MRAAARASWGDDRLARSGAQQPPCRSVARQFVFVGEHVGERLGSRERTFPAACRGGGCLKPAQRGEGQDALRDGGLNGHSEPPIGGLQGWPDLRGVLAEILLADRASVTGAVTRQALGQLSLVERGGSVAPNPLQDGGQPRLRHHGPRTRSEERPAGGAGRELLCGGAQCVGKRVAHRRAGAGEGNGMGEDLVQAEPPEALVGARPARGAARHGGAAGAVAWHRKPQTPRRGSGPVERGCRSVALADEQERVAAETAGFREHHAEDRRSADRGVDRSTAAPQQDQSRPHRERMARGDGSARASQQRAASRASGVPQHGAA